MIPNFIYKFNPYTAHTKNIESLLLRLGLKPFSLVSFTTTRKSQGEIKLDELFHFLKECSSVNAFYQ